jgi:acylphosphatase
MVEATRSVKRMQVFFSGTVQGVGFRFTAERLARRFSVNGFVRNLDDGGVEVVAEGEEAVLTHFLTAIRESGMEHYIQDVKAHWSDAQGTFKGFRIAY